MTILSRIPIDIKQPDLNKTDFFDLERHLNVCTNKFIKSQQIKLI